jgi:denticleless
MATRRRLSPTFFGGLRARELGGASVSSRATAGLPYLADLSSDPGGRGGGVIAVEHSGDPAIPFAISFGKVRSLRSVFIFERRDPLIRLACFGKVISYSLLRFASTNLLMNCLIRPDCTNL